MASHHAAIQRKFYDHARFFHIFAIGINHEVDRWFGGGRQHRSKLRHHSAAFKLHRIRRVGCGGFDAAHQHQIAQPDSSFGHVIDAKSGGSGPIAFAVDGCGLYGVEARRKGDQASESQCRGLQRSDALSRYVDGEILTDFLDRVAFRILDHGEHDHVDASLAAGESSRHQSGARYFESDGSLGSAFGVRPEAVGFDAKLQVARTRVGGEGGHRGHLIRLGGQRIVGGCAAAQNGTRFIGDSRRR